MFTRVRNIPGFDRLLGDGFRFLLAGGLNTLFTLLLYQLLLFGLGPKLAWSLAWFSGLILVSVAYPTLVFRGGKLTWKRFSVNLIYYLCSFFVSLLLLSFFGTYWKLNPRLAAFCVLAVTVPLNFLVSRFIFTVRRIPCLQH